MAGAGTARSWCRTASTDGLARAWTRGRCGGCFFAARWDRDAAHGAQALQNCYDDYWSKGENGGLADQFCNAANTGLGKDEAKFARDVAYAIYLLTGKEPSGLSEFIPPRWTLDD